MLAPYLRPVELPDTEILELFDYAMGFVKKNDQDLMETLFDINLTLSAENVTEGIFEVCVTATVNTKVGDKTLFLVEAKQAGIFEIRNIPQDQLEGILGIVCPQMVYPYLRAIVSDVCTRAGFPPVLLTEVNFQAMFEAQQAQRAAQAVN